MNQFMKVMKVERVINLWNENEAKVIQLCGLNNNRASNTLWNCGVK